jgi:heme exporter protein CcmD
MILLSTGFFAMGGYGAFIWSAYAAAMAALGGLVLVSRADRRRVRRGLATRGLDRRR